MKRMRLERIGVKDGICARVSFWHRRAVVEPSWSVFVR